MKGNAPLTFIKGVTLTGVNGTFASRQIFTNFDVRQIAVKGNVK